MVGIFYFKINLQIRHIVCYICFMANLPVNIFDERNQIHREILEYDYYLNRYNENSVKLSMPLSFKDMFGHEVFYDINFSIFYIK